MNQHKLCGCGMMHDPLFVCDWKIMNAWSDKCHRLEAERDLWKSKAEKLAETLRQAYGELEVVDWEGRPPTIFYEIKEAIADFEQGGRA